MFIHSRTIKIRIVALILASVTAYLLVLITPTVANTKGATANAVLGMLLVVAIGLLGACAYLWKVAPRMPQEPLPDAAKWKGPNQIPFGTRAFYVVASALLLSYGTYGLYIGDIYVPGKRGNGVHMTGASAWFMYFALVCAGINLLAVVVDHYDKRNNEMAYVNVAAATQWLGWAFFAGSYLKTLF